MQPKPADFLVRPIFLFSNLFPSKKLSPNYSIKIPAFWNLLSGAKRAVCNFKPTLG